MGRSVIERSDRTQLVVDRPRNLGSPDSSAAEAPTPAGGSAMDEHELIRIAIFKVAATARRMDALAGAAQTADGRHLLGTVARLLELYEQDLRASLTVPEETKDRRAIPS